MSPSKPSFTLTQPETSTHNCGDATKEVESDDKESLLMIKLKEDALLKRHCMQRLKKHQCRDGAHSHFSFFTCWGLCVRHVFQPNLHKVYQHTTGRFAPQSKIWHEVRQQPKRVVQPTCFLQLWGICGPQHHHRWPFITSASKRGIFYAILCIIDLINKLVPKNENTTSEL